jgi:DNA-binding PadR family transcriptional regulator
VEGRARAEYNPLLSGFIRMHILHHAAETPVYGLWVIEELRRHGYRLSPGTLYPILHGMEAQGYLRSSLRTDGRSRRRVYATTAKGRRALAAAKIKLRELFGEVVREVERRGSAARTARRTGTKART